jgi:ketosteroid isomerase-like protein
MSDDNVEMVRGAYDALARRNIEGLLDVLHHEVDWFPVTALIAGGQRYTGRYGVGEWFRYVTDNWAEYSERPTDFNGIDKYVLALGSVCTQAREGEAPQHTPASWLWRIEERLAVSVHAYLDHAKAAETLRQLTRDR